LLLFFLHSGFEHVLELILCNVNELCASVAAWNLTVKGKAQECWRWVAILEQILYYSRCGYSYN